MYQRQQPAPEFEVVKENAEKAPDFSEGTEKPESLERVEDVENTAEQPLATTPAPTQTQSQIEDTLTKEIEGTETSSTPEALSSASIAEDEPTNIDKTYVKAANGIIDRLEGKPYEEEVEHQKLQVKYLWQRFKRVLRIGDK